MIVCVFLHKNLCCGFSLELPRRGDSNEHYNIGFYEDLTKIIFELSSNTHLISSADYVTHSNSNAKKKKNSQKEKI